MRRKLLNQYGFDRKLRQLSVLIALLLLPIGAWAEDYDLWIGETQVTDANKDDLAAANSNIKVGNATFDPTTSTLYLNSIQTKDCIKSELTSLKISLQGANRIGYIANEDDTPAIYSTETHGTLAFMKPQSYASLYVESMMVESVIYGFSSFNFSNFNVNSSGNVSYSSELGLNDGENGVMEATFYTGSLYPIWVGKTQVTSGNLSDIKDDNISAGTVSYNPTANILTLNNVNIDMASDDPYVVESSIADLKVRLVGENEVTLDAEMYGTTGPNPIAFANFTGTAGETSPTLTFKSEWDKNESSFGLLTINGAATETIIAQGYTVSNTWVTDDNATNGWKKTVNSDNVNVWYLGETYDLTINGVKVTTDNAENVLEGFGSGVISFNASTNTLTLNDLMDYPENEEPYITNGLESLTIHLLGYSRILGSNTYFLAKSGDGEGNNTVTFTTDSQNPGSLEFYGTNISPWYTGHTVNWSNGFGWRFDGDSDYGSSAYISTDNGLSVGNVILCDNDGNAFNEGPFGDSVTYDEDTNTLTLNNATINGNIVSKLAGDLTVHLVGTNVIHNGEHAFMMTGEGSLKFTADNGAKLLTDATTDAMFAYSTSGNGGAIELGIDDLPSGYKLSFDAELKRSIGESYDILIYAFTNGSSNLGPQCITSANCDRLAGAYDETTSTWDNETITLSYDYATTTLTLNNMNIETASPNGTVYFINCDGSKAENITINLLGENKLRQFEGEESARFIYNGAEDGQITITTDPENPGTLTMPDMEEYLEETNIFEMRYDNHVKYKNGLGYVKDENNVRYIKTIPTLPSLGLTVAGITVTAANAENVLDEVNEETELPTVVFDAENNILTLNGAYIYVESEDAIVSSLENLTIFLVGDNNISCYGDKMFNKTSAVDEATITFTTDEESNGSLSFMCLEEQIYGVGVTPVYNNVFIKHVGDSHYINSSWGISVGGVDVTPFNKDNVLGDNKVSYNAETNTLTLNNATIEPDEEFGETSGIVYSNDENFTIELIGNNSVQGSYGCSAIAHYGNETTNLSFARVGDQHFSLDLMAQTGDFNDFIDGFETDLSSFFVFDNEDDGTYSKTISSSILGGTGSEEEPFLIKTSEDLKQFANYYNEGFLSRNVRVKLNNDIDCEDLEDLTTIANNSNATFIGVFDGNHKTISNLTMTGVGLFGYVKKDGDDVGTIKDLTLSGLELTGEEGEPVTGGIVAYLYEGAVVSNCTVANSTIACESSAYNPTVAAIAAQMSGAIVTGCVVDNVMVKAETSYYSGSGPEGVAGGVVATAYEGTISSCVVRNGTKITDYYADENADLRAGAIVGKANGTTLTENYYYYDVTVEILNGTDETNKIIKSEYQQRGNGGKTWNEQTQQYEDILDLFDNDGAVMYTQPVMLPEETEEASVMAEEGTYYSTITGSDVLGLLVAPGQTVTLNVTPGEGYTAPSLTATNTNTEATISVESEDLGDNITQYTFEMPDAPVTVALTTAQTMGIRVAGVEVTERNSTDVLGDGKVSFTAAVPATDTTPAVQATLTLNGVDYSPTGTDPLVVSGLDNLTVKLVGSNSVYVSSTAEVYPEAAFVSSNSEASLTFTTDESDRLQPLNTNTVVLASGFNNIVFTGYLYRDQNMVKNLLAPTPNMSEGYLAINRAGYEPDATTFNYEIEYVDGSESATGTYDMSKTASDNNIVLDKPCTVTVYAQYGTVKSAEKVGKLFGFADGNELNVTYGTTQIEMPALVPAIAEADGITISREGNFVDDDKTMIDLEGKTAGNAATTIITSLTSSDNTPYILLNTIVNLSINITKATPTITFAQERYSATLGETFTSPATVDYWTVSPTASSNTSVANISEGQIVLVGVGTTTITVTYAGNDNYNSTTASYELVVSRALDVAFVGSNLWASYYATENLSIPENLTAYVVDDVDEMTGEVTVSPISYIPEYNAVLLKRADGASANGYVAAPYTGTTSSVPNLLNGSDEAVDISDINGGSVYVLYNDMFKRATSGTIPARRGYLVLGIEQVSRLNIVFDDTSTAISTLAVEEKGENWYSVDGRKLSGQPQRRGLYIKNGKKVFVTNNK